MSNVRSKLRRARQTGFLRWFKTHNFDAWIRLGEHEPGSKEYQAIRAKYAREYNFAMQRKSIKDWHEKNPRSDFRLPDKNGRMRGKHQHYNAQC